MREIKFDELYQICKIKRALIKAGGFRIKNYNSILEQLLCLCFSNPQKPDTLPQVFVLTNLQMYTSDIKSFIEDLLDVKVYNMELIKNSYAYGNTVKIYLKD